MQGTFVFKVSLRSVCVFLIFANLKSRKLLFVEQNFVKAERYLGLYVVKEYILGLYVANELS